MTQLSSDAPTVKRLTRDEIMSQVIDIAKKPDTKPTAMAFAMVNAAIKG